MNGLSTGEQIAVTFAVFMGLGCALAVGWLVKELSRALWRSFINWLWRPLVVEDPNYSRRQFRTPGGHQTQAPGRWRVGDDAKKVGAFR